MKMSLKKRFALGAAAVATVGAVATLVAGVTFGLFSATTGPTTTTPFTAGTVTLTSDADRALAPSVHMVAWRSSTAGWAA